MTQVTPIYSFPYPEPTDAPDGPTQIHNLALAVETVVARTDQKNKLIVFTASGSLLASQVTGAKALRVRVVGGGGGGGAVGAPGGAAASRASGGGGGGYAESILDITTVTFPVTITVGPTAAGGASGGANNGTVGNDSSFAATVIGKGGGAGGAGQAVAAGVTSSSGTALVTGNTGQITMDGGVAQPGYILALTTLIGGAAGSSAMGGTGQYPNTGNATAAGRNATANQGGGGGGACAVTGGATQAGGTGGSGLVVVEVIY